MRFNITVSNISPLLSYLPQLLWSEADPSDPLLSTYQFKSYHSTNASNASISFSWAGTGIWVYGGYRERSGPYTVMLDQNSTGHQGYKAGDVEKADSLLFGAPALSPGTHRIELQNMISNDGHGVLDFSYLVFETYDDILRQNATTPNNTVTTGSADPQFHFTTPSGTPEWVIGPSNASITNSSAGQADFTFTVRSAVALYGSLRGPSARCSIAVDSGDRLHSVIANTRAEPGVQLLYFSNGLTYGNHTLTIINNPTSPDVANVLVIQKAVTYGSNSSVLGSPEPSETPSPASGKQYVVPLAVGATSGATLIIAAWALSRWYARRRSRARQKHEIRTPRPFLVHQLREHRGTLRQQGRGTTGPSRPARAHVARAGPGLIYNPTYA